MKIISGTVGNQSDKVKRGLLVFINWDYNGLSFRLINTCNISFLIFNKQSLAFIWELNNVKKRLRIYMENFGH